MRKSLAKSPADRYPTAAALRGGVERGNGRSDGLAAATRIRACPEQSAQGAHAFHRTRNRVGRVRSTPRRDAAADRDGDWWKWKDATCRQARGESAPEPSGWCVVRGSESSERSVPCRGGDRRDTRGRRRAGEGPARDSRSSCAREATAAGARQLRASARGMWRARGRVAENRR